MSKSTPSIPRDNPSIADLTQSERHTLLMSRRRRLVVEILEMKAPPTELSDLATEITRREEGAEECCDQTRQKVEISLHHNHLPKMDALGVIDYDTEQHRITF